MVTTRDIEIRQGCQEKKYWLALLEMYVAKDKTAHSQKDAACAPNLAPASAVRSGSESASRGHTKAADPKAGGVRAVR